MNVKVDIFTGSVAHVGLIPICAIQIGYYAYRQANAILNRLDLIREIPPLSVLHNTSKSLCRNK